MSYRWGCCYVDVMWNDSTLATYNPISKFRHKLAIHPVTATIGTHWRSITILTIMSGDCTIKFKNNTFS